MSSEYNEKSVKELFIGKCWDYLSNNFHKFTPTNQIKVALELAKKNMPTEIQGTLNVTMMPTVKVNGKDLEVDIR